MKKQKGERISVSSKIGVIFILSVIAIGLFWFLSTAFGRKTLLPVLGDPGHVAGSFSFVNQDGRRISEKDVQGKITVVEYFFTSCPSICPVMNKNLSAVYTKFRGEPGFMILSHTVDPERDSPAVLKNYARRYQASTPSWQFLTGDKEDLYRAASRDYLLAVEDSTYNRFIHTQYIALLDEKRRIRGFYDATSSEAIERLEKDIRQLIGELN